MSKQLLRQPGTCANFETELCKPEVVRYMDDLMWEKVPECKATPLFDERKWERILEICSKCKHFKNKNYESQSNT